MTTLLHISERVLNRPLLLLPSHAELVLSVLRDRLISGMALDVPAPDMSQFTGSRKRSENGNRSPVRTEGGVAIISVLGDLVNRGAWLDADMCTGLTSYEGIGLQMAAAANDKSVNSILLDIESPGGEAAGMFNLASTIREARKTKHVVAVVNDMSASAAYGIASAADEIAISPTSLVGSIGVVLLHADYSGAMEQKGIKPTLIHAGAHKVDGNPFEALSPAVRSALQKQVEAFYTKFVEAVWRGRGARTTADAARATEARIFLGQEAIDAGLADRIATFDTVLQDLSTRQAKGRTKPSGATKMEADDKKFTQAEMDKATTDAKAAGVAEGETKGRAAGVSEERARASGILGLEETSGREPMAHVLVKTGASVEDAKTSLAAMPKGTAPKSVADRSGNQPDLTAQNPQNPSSAKSAWDKAVAAHNASIPG